MLHKGWRVPSGLERPIDVAVLNDDFHVIIFPESHPRFEAVEAMIRLRGSTAPIIRAIATLHDQSQTDFLNDAQTFRASESAGRRAFLTQIDAHVQRDDRRITAQVSFASEAGEKIEIVFAGAGLPDIARSGLTDPGRHSIGSSLPIMWRESSTIGIDGSHVDIDGAIFAASPLQRIGPHLTLRRAFMSEGHRMAVIRAGSRRLEGVDRCDPAVLRSLERLTIPSADGRIEFMLDFDDDRFRCRLGKSGNLIAGKAWTEIHEETLKLALEPDSPAWATARPVLVTLSPAAEGPGYTAVTEIGATLRGQADS